MRRVLALLALGWPLLASAGTSDRLDTLERRMDSVSEQLLDLSQLKRENAELHGQIEVLRHELDQLKNQQRELYLDIDRRLSGDQAPAAEPPAPVPPAVEPTTAPEQSAGPATAAPVVSQSAGDGEASAYQEAYGLLIPEKKYDEAVAAFNAFLRTYPNGDYADNAQFWLGEAHYANRQYDQAIAEFQKLSEVYPSSPKVPDALLKVGYIRHAQGDYDKARQVFEGVIQHYPDTAAARLAQQRLESLR